MSVVRGPSTSTGIDLGGAISVVALVVAVVAGYYCIVFLVGVFSNIASLGSVLFLKSVLFAALSGFVIGWVRRAFHVRKALGESFLSALLTSKLFEEEPVHVATEILLKTVTGYCVGVTYALGNVSLSRDAYLTTMGIIAWGAGGGGPDNIGFFWMILAIAVLLLVATLVGIVSMLLADRIAVWILVKLTGQGAVTGAVKEFTSVLVEKGSADRSALKAGSKKGAVTGLIVGVLLLFWGTLGTLIPNKLKA